MAIIFRELNTEEEQIVRENLSYWILENQMDVFFNSYHFIIGEGKWKEIFIITNDMKKFLENNPTITPYTLGLGFGEIKKSEIFLTLSGASFILQFTTKIVVVSPDAEQPFLYKNHILVKSILKCNPKAQINDKLLVTNKEGDLLGIGQLKVAVNELSNKKSEDYIGIYNILDLGWYLRKGK